MEDARLTKRSIDIKDIKEVAVINAQIGFDVESFNFNVYVRDKAMLNENIEEAKAQFQKYMGEIFDIAINMGWDVFKNK